MKKLLGSFGAGLFVALAASFLLTRSRNVANEPIDQRAQLQRMFWLTRNASPKKGAMNSFRGKSTPGSPLPSCSI
jgi:hypothetical protein